MSNFNEVTPLCYWVQKVLPLVYDDSLSYYELLNKVVKKLNDLIKNNASLPDFIRDLIEQYITSGAIEEVVSTVLASFILNVKFPPEGLTPAVGDGTADDTIAIQGCIDYANSHGGKAVYFPSGAYLTQSITLKNNVSLVGFDSSTTKLVLKGGAVNALLTGTVENCTLSRLKFDSNMDIQVNNVNLMDLTVSDFYMSDLFLNDGYDLLNITSTGRVIASNLIFDNAVRDALIITGSGIVNFNNIIFRKLSSLNGRYIINNNINGAVFSNINSVAVTDIPINNSGDNCVFIGNIVNSVTKILNDTGNNTYYNFYNNGSTLQTHISNETIARESGDATLQTAINNETIAREFDSASLQAQIDTEKTARESGDSALQLAITNESVARESADIALQANIENLELEINNAKIFYNVKDFGALGDGVHDDTQAFINAIGTGNRSVYVPTGVYMITPITLDNVKNLTIFGNGWFSSQIRIIENGFGLSFTNSSKIFIDKICFNPVPELTNSNGINIGFNSTLTITNCLFYANTGDGIKSVADSVETGTSGNIIGNCYFTGIGHSAINTKHFNDFTIYNCEFGRYTQTGRPAFGILMQNSSNGSIYGCSQWEAENGIYLYQCEYDRIVNNRFESNFNFGLKIEACNYIIITNNWINDNSSEGVGLHNHLDIFGGNMLTVSSNMFGDWNTDAHAKYCIYLSNGASGCEISNNNGNNYTDTFIKVNTDTLGFLNNFDSFLYTHTGKLNNGSIFAGQNVNIDSNGAYWICPFDCCLTITQIDVTYPATNNGDYTYKLYVDGVLKTTYIVESTLFQKYFGTSIDIQKGQKVYIECVLSNVSIEAYHSIMLNLTKR